MHHQSKERNMSKSQKKTKKKQKKTKFFFDPFGLARFRFNEVRINEVPLYEEFSGGSPLACGVISIASTNFCAGQVGGSLDPKRGPP